MDSVEVVRIFRVEECPRAEKHIDGEEEDHGLITFFRNVDPYGTDAWPTWIGYCPDTADPIFLATDSEGKEVVLAAD